MPASPTPERTASVSERARALIVNAFTSEKRYVAGLGNAGDAIAALKQLTDYIAALEADRAARSSGDHMNGETSDAQ